VEQLAFPGLRNIEPEKQNVSVLLSGFNTFDINWCFMRTNSTAANVGELQAPTLENTATIHIQ
jgi:hypothetical protein